eukprot:scaffold24385_cov101-Isochrysis_galbana.AAC.3
MLRLLFRRAGGRTVACRKTRWSVPLRLYPTHGRRAIQPQQATLARSVGGAPSPTAYAAPASSRATVATRTVSRSAIATIAALAALAGCARIVGRITGVRSLHPGRPGGGELQVHHTHLTSGQCEEAPAEPAGHHLELARSARPRIQELFAHDQHILAAWRHAALQSADLRVDIVAVENLLIRTGAQRDAVVSRQKGSAIPILVALDKPCLRQRNLEPVGEHVVPRRQRHRPFARRRRSRLGPSRRSEEQRRQCRSRGRGRPPFARAPYDRLSLTAVPGSSFGRARAASAVGHPLPQRRGRSALRRSGRARRVPHSKPATQRV